MQPIEILEAKGLTSLSNKNADLCNIRVWNNLDDGWINLFHDKEALKLTLVWFCLRKHTKYQDKQECMDRKQKIVKYTNAWTKFMEQALEIWAWTQKIVKIPQNIQWHKWVWLANVFLRVTNIDY